MIIPNVAATPDCSCSTCNYIRSVSAPQPPVVPKPPRTDGQFTCGCGAVVGSMQIHLCPWSVGTWCGSPQ